MKAYNKTMGYVGVVALAIGAASPSFAQQSGPSCMAEIAQARARIARALAAFPNPADSSGPNSGAGRELARGLPTPTDPGGPNSGAGRELAAGIAPPADPGGPNSGAGQSVAAATGSSGQGGRIQEAQALVGAAQTACDAGDTANAVAKARQAVTILK